MEGGVCIGEDKGGIGFAGQVGFIPFPLVGQVFPLGSDREGVVGIRINVARLRMSCDLWFEVFEDLLSQVSGGYGIGRRGQGELGFGLA